MRYFGSKAAVADEVMRMVTSRAPAGGTFCDAFGGVGTIGSAAKRVGLDVHSGDQLRFAVCFQVARVGLSAFPPFSSMRSLGLLGAQGVEEHLATLEGCDGWLVDEYARARGFFTEANARLIERCRQEIGRWKARGLLSVNEHAHLIASLIAASDRVANTAGTYYAHLKQWDRKALNRFCFKLLVPSPGIPGEVHLGEALALVGRRDYDVVYLDPPYNRRRYGSYYHLPETLAIGDEPHVKGSSGIPRRHQPDSPFYSSSRATSALADLVDRAGCDLLVLHYADGGLISRNDAREILAARGHVEEVELSALGYSTSAGKRRVGSHFVFLSRA